MLIEPTRQLKTFVAILYTGLSQQGAN